MQTYTEIFNDLTVGSGIGAHVTDADFNYLNGLLAEIQAGLPLIEQYVLPALPAEVQVQAEVNREHHTDRAYGICNAVSAGPHELASNFNYYNIPDSVEDEVRVLVQQMAKFVAVETSIWGAA